MSRINIVYLCLVAMFAVQIGCGDDHVAGVEGLEITALQCQDGEDNDSDGVVDCLDPDCQGFVFCVDWGTGDDAETDAGSDADSGVVDAHNDSDTSVETDADSGVAEDSTDTDTGTETDADSGVADTHTDSNTDAETDSDAGSDADSGVADTHTDSNTDAETDSDAGSDADSGVADTHTYSDTDAETDTETDTLPPQVFFTSPVMDATEVPTNTLVSIAFNEPIDPSTLSTASFTLEDELGTPVDGVVVAGTMGGTFTPDSALSFNTTYFALVSTTVTDEAGNPLADEFSWRFTTSDAPDVTAPQILGTSPNPGVTEALPTTLVWISFNELIDPSTLNATTFRLEDLEGTLVSGTVEAGAMGGTFTPDHRLTFDTTYIATVTTEVTDQAGNPLAEEFSWWFAVGHQRWRAPEPVETDDEVHRTPGVAVDPAGNAVVVWNNLVSGVQEISANRYVVGSGWGTAERIDHEDASHAGWPVVAMDQAGNAVSAWTEYDGTSHNIYANRYEVDSGWGAAELIETEDEGANSPQIAMDSAGNAFVVWPHHDGGRTDMWANRYEVGSGWGDAELIGTGEAHEVEKSHVAVDSAGNAVAVWRQSNGIRFEIWASRYVVGSGWGDVELIETDDANWGNNPQVAVDSAGNALVVWDQWDGDRTYIWANRYEVGSGWGGDEFVENSITGTGPRVAMDSAGNATVLWRKGDGEVITSRYEVDSGWSYEGGIDTGSNDVGSPQLVVDSVGNAVVLWSLDNDLWFNRYEIATGWGSPDTIGSRPGRLYGNHIAANSAGYIFVVWNQNFDIWASRYQ